MGESSITVSSDHAVLHVRGSGFFGQALVTDHFVELEREIARRRAAGVTIRVVVDLTGADVQSQDVAELILAAARRLYQPEDRVAAVVRGGLARLQLGRVLKDSVVAVHASAVDAHAHVAAG